MKAAILAIGTELTRGELCDSNSCWLSEQLTDLGVDVLEHVTVDDDDARIGAALLQLGNHVDLLLVTGGLGPTSDDRTAAAAAAALGVPLRRDADSLVAIEARYAAAGRRMPETNRKQADLPDSAVPLPNGEGTAPGFRCGIGQADCFFMPGVPKEMRHLFKRHVQPVVVQHVKRCAYQEHLRTFGLPESLVAERLAELEAGGKLHDPQVTLGYRASFPEIEVKIFARAESEALAQEKVARATAVAKERLAPHVFGGRGDGLPAAVGKVLVAQGLRVATAESCTGGLVGSLLTEVPGSSGYYVGSVVAYHNTAKAQLLHVDKAVLDQHGAVSEQVAAAMVKGLFSSFDVQIGVAITGVAGPSGGTADKPVGTVCFAVGLRDQEPVTLRRHFPWGRNGVRTYSAQFALMLLWHMAQGTLEPDVWAQQFAAPPKGGH